MTHVVLLGDSIFDNAAYVPGEPAVAAQLKAAMPEAEVTLLALDGAVVGDVPAQLTRLPADATHLVLSVGGNDTLGYIDVLSERHASLGESMLRMSELTGGFEDAYRRMIEAVLAASLPTIVCTIYYPSFPERALQRMAVAAETFFNDAILRCAFELRLPILDLRLICDEPADYANPIEPSARGGRKITAAIARTVREHDFARPATVYTRA